MFVTTKIENIFSIITMMIGGKKLGIVNGKSFIRFILLRTILRIE